MSLAICVFITCCTLITLTLIPKKLSELDMVFVYFSSTIFELSIFTIFHVNLNWIAVNPSVETSFADLVLRLIHIPLLLLISTNILLYNWKVLKWLIVAGMLLICLPMQVLLERLQIISTPHWNVFHTLVTFAGYMAFSRWMAWWIRYVGRKVANAR
ncbi:hypothetical protein [Paenibacillus cremeus]|uniref:Uncharacterized protein n=1 Tax=Paenibacillus cremeus TaxID=2163881 RepID=A0A559KIK6_9BACL|nr:hypothetical protein [Paenibacillus cremeus]TVY11973.1 hypothetical protein FPZ49_01460 [Paenibacillus cremeus]